MVKTETLLVSDRLLLLWWQAIHLICLWMVFMWLSKVQLLLNFAAQIEHSNFLMFLWRNSCFLLLNCVLNFLSQDLHFNSLVPSWALNTCSVSWHFRCGNSRHRISNTKCQKLQWCQIENQQTPVYVVNSHFSRGLDGCWDCYHNLALLNNPFHI